MTPYDMLEEEMKYPTAIVIAAALIAVAIFAQNPVGAASGVVGRYQIWALQDRSGMSAFRIDTVTGVVDVIVCVLESVSRDTGKACIIVLDAAAPVPRSK